MNYLFVSGSLYDLGGLAMIRGAMNGISELDKAEFASLHRPEHNRDICKQFEEPSENEEAFEWADVILDVGGLFTNQPNKYDWLKLRKDKPYILMSQSFMEVDPKLLEGATVIARGKNSAQTLGIDCYVAPDLSFLIEPEEWTGKKYTKAFSTHIIKDLHGMSAFYKDNDLKRNCVQVIWKPPTDEVWEPELPIDRFHGTVEQNFGLIASVDEVHAARYHAACAAILAGKPLTIYGTKDEKYNLKYDDLLDYSGLSRKKLRKQAMLSCELAVGV